MVRDQPEGIDAAAQQVAVVGDQQQRAFVLLQGECECLAHLQVQVVRRFVEHQHRRLLAGDERQHQAGLLAAGERVRGAPCVVAAKSPAAQIVRRLLAGEGAASRFGGLVEVLVRRPREVEGFQLMLREVADRGVATANQRPGERLDLPGQATQQRRLACTVGTEHADAVVRIDAQRRVAQHRFAAVAERGVVELQDRVRYLARRREREPIGRLGMQRRSDGKLLERLQAALHLPRLALLGAESVHETLDLRDAQLLLLVQRRLSRQRFGALPLEGAVVAHVHRRLAAFQMRDALHGAVEEVAVVRHHREGAWVLAHPGFQPHRRLQVQVVGRLVEQQQVRGRHQRLGEIEADAPAAGERPMRLGEVVLAEAEAAENLPGASFGVVAADVFVVRIEPAEGVVVAIAFGNRNGAFHPAQRPVAVEHEVEGAPGRRLHVLVQPSDAPGAWPHHVAFFRQDAIPRQGQQRALADAVAPHDADLVAVMHRQVEAVEQQPVAAMQRDVAQLQHGLG